jgi:multiple sugar transport system permease protein
MPSDGSTTTPTTTAERSAGGSSFRAERPAFPVTRPDYSGSPTPPAASSPGTAARDRRNLALGLAFLAPNIIGFLTFTAIPLVFSLVLAFSNWDLKLHNMFKPEAEIEFVGLTNFTRLFGLENFWKFLGNTLFFMIGMPFSIAASLGAAVMLSKDLRGGSKRVWLGLIAGAVLVASALMLVSAGAGGTAMTLLMGGVTSGILIAGVLGGTTIYRTLFYVPHFTSGVATYLLWKKLYNPTIGPITTALTPPLQALADAVNATPAALWQAIAWACLAGVIVTFLAGARRLRTSWADGDVGWLAAVMSAAFVALPVALGVVWLSGPAYPAAVPVALGLAALAAAAVVVFRAVRTDRTFTSTRLNGAGSGLMLAMAVMVAQLVLIGFVAIFWQVPAWAADEGLQTPMWLQDVHWAKPAIMIMGFWGAIGSNTMLLYLAALTNVPQELYEAADIDGASRFQKFWNVTWPQLAPTTFFIVVMGVIGGLQGGFEMARVMTQGGPAGQTTTLSYYIYTEGFETGRLGFSSAVAWTLFLMVLLVTLFNWKFGNKYVNE